MNDKKKSTEDKKKTVQQMKEADRKSKQYVEELLDTGDIKKIEEILMKIKFITPSQYKDVVEERSIINNCGYPLCGNKLESTPKQKYLIRENKVFDITERKMFCSNKCYESSATLQSKVPTTALWLRDKENDIMLSQDVSGKHGEEVELLSKISKEVLNDLKNDRMKKVVTFQEENDIMIKEDEAVIKDDNRKSDNKNNATASKEEKKPFQINSVKPKLAHSPKPSDYYQMSLKTMNEWMTRSTLEYLGLQKKETAIEEICNEKKLEELNDYKMKVEQFFKGNYVTIKPEERKKKKIEVKENSNLSDVQLPTVDNVSQMRIRRKILHQRLSGYATSIIPVLGMHAPSLLHEFRQLIATFQLSSANTMLQQPQLPIVTVIMLVLLTNINTELSQRLKSSENAFNKLLKAFHVNMNQLHKDVDMQLMNSIIP